MSACLLLGALLGSTRALGADSPAYASCVEASDPPACLISRAAHAPDPFPSFLETVILSGAGDLIAPNANRLVDEAVITLSESGAFLRSLGIIVGDEEEHTPPAASRRMFLAAIALAAAAQTQDDPFVHPIATTLRGEDRSRAAQIALMLWAEFDTYSEWRSPLTRPRGVGRLWGAIMETRPTDPRQLLRLARLAAWESPGHEALGLELLLAIVARPDASPNLKAEAASTLARRYRRADEAEALMQSGGQNAPNYDADGIRTEIARARLYAGYDPVVARQVLDAALAQMREHDAGYSRIFDNAQRALAAASAQTELRALGDAYLARARTPNRSPIETGDWFALASDCFRLAGDLDRAIAAAREGFPFVEPAVGSRVAILSEPPATPREAAEIANAFGTAPVVALYRAGAREEALATGYLTGYERFNADVDSNVTPNLDDTLRHDWYAIGRLVEGHVYSEAGANLRVPYYEALRRTNYTGAIESTYFLRLGIAAAAAGRGDDMRAHFARAARAIDVISDDRASDALALAAAWRRGEVILSRQSVQH